MQATLPAGLPLHGTCKGVTFIRCERIAHGTLLTIRMVRLPRYYTGKALTPLVRTYRERRMDWNVAKVAFEWDGSWRDIYLLATDEKDWQRLLAWLARSAYRLEFTTNGQPRPLPQDTAEIFVARSETMLLLRVDPEHLGLNCHFFGVEQIEFDLDPRDITDADRFGSLLEFMRGLSEVLGKEIRLTPENMENLPYFRFTPQTGSWEWYA